MPGYVQYVTAAEFSIYKLPNPSRAAKYCHPLRRGHVVYVLLVLEGFIHVHHITEMNQRSGTLQMRRQQVLKRFALVVCGLTHFPPYLLVGKYLDYSQCVITVESAAVTSTRVPDIAWKLPDGIWTTVSGCH